jgi:hypothetical protein
VTTAPPYLTVDGRPLRMTLGLRPLDERSWLEVDHHYSDELAQKRQLLASQPDELVVHRPEGQAAAEETYALVHDWMSRQHPEILLPLRGDEHPIDAAGRLVQEDLCVLTDADGPWRLTAASVCFPSRWRLADKLGATVAQIHAPVPGYGSISDVVDGVLDRLAPGSPLWRLNWTIVDSPALFLPPDGDASMAADIDRLVFRVERQTLRRLPTTAAVLFTIRTYRTRLREIVADPVAAQQLADTLSSCPLDRAEYKGWLPVLDELVDTLRAHSRTGPLAD